MSEHRPAGRFVLAALAAVMLVAPAGVRAEQPEPVAPHAGMLRDPDVSATHIAFRYADDLWLVPREGGVAVPLASPPGSEAQPRFSPDGERIAFIAHYDGDPELYTMPAGGGVPIRATHQPSLQMLCDWTPDGRLLYFTDARNGLLARTELYTVAPSGGMPSRLPVPYGAEAAMSADGRWLAYAPIVSRWVGSWKRYVGGSAGDLWLADLEQGDFRKITAWEGTDGFPMWHDGTIYYLSDAGPAHRLNIWSFDPGTGQRRQLTFFEELDVRSPAVGPGPEGSGEIVFTVGEDLHLLDLASGKDRVVEVSVPGARPALRPQALDVADAIGHASVAPGGSRIAVEARGDIWTLPAQHGSPRNLTRSSGVAERYPSWSPDGRWIAYFSDRSAEYELHLVQSDGRGEERQVTSGHETFFYPPEWSPDSEHLVFQEKTGALWLCAVDSGELVKVATDPWPNTRPEGRRAVSFSPDGRWLAFDLPEPAHEYHRSLWLYDIAGGELHRATSALADEALPVFARDGSHLYFVAQRRYEPTYSEVEFTWVHRDTHVLMALPLRADVERPFAPTSDEVEWDGQDAPKETEEDEPSEPSEEGSAPVEIDFEGLQQRAYTLKAAPGTFSFLGVNDAGHVLYLRRSGGNGGDKPRLQLLDPADEKGEEKLVLEGVQAAALSPDGATIAARTNGNGAPKLLPAKPGAEAKSPVTAGMLAHVRPREEWRQLFDDTWRLFRDYFYDPGMHGLDWAAVRDRYAAMLPDCASRADLSHVLREMIGELNVSHARYRGPGGGGDDGPGVGLLGVDFELAAGAYRFARIYRGPVWDPEVRSPLTAPGVDVEEGEYLLAVNGVPVDPAVDPWAPFVGLAGREVTLTVGPNPALDDAARDVVVQPRDHGWEQRLRYRSWVEQTRRDVAEATGGRVGYVHIPNYIPSGLGLLVEQFFPQQDRDALIIDQRFNGGGWTPDRFLEILNRPPLMYRARRDGLDRAVPNSAHFGPKCLLMNELSGSSGDMFPWMFRHAGLGPLIGTRTWGGVVGLSGNPALIDGSQPVIPNNGTYSPDGRWIVEGWGVDPDIEVPDDPSAALAGRDLQLEAAIEQMLRALEDPDFIRPEPPAPPDRAGIGIPPEER
jgi:tricorn protease